MTKSMQRKLKMAMMIGFAVLCTTSLTVSTFAWFISRNKATFSTNRLTVDNPNAFSFYAYRGNPDPNYIPEEDTDDDGNPDHSFEDDFIPLSAESSQATLDHFLSFNGMYPGKSMTYAFKLEGRTSANLSISKLTSNDATMENLALPRYIAASGSTSINVGWAMNVYVTTLTVESGYTSFVNDPSNGYQSQDLFLYDETSDNQAYHRQNYLAGSTTNNVVTLSNPIPLFSSSSLSGTTYLLISVMFSDENTTYFQEVDGNTGNAAPVDAVPENALARYFRKSTSGNSNCYSNLTFALNELKLV